MSRKTLHLLFLRSLAVSCLLPLVLPAQEEKSDAEIDFNRDIRPILSDNCFACHGPDEGQRKAGLRLDLREGLFGKAGDLTVVDPGHPEQSEVFYRITAEDEDERMPPEDYGKTLNAEQIELVRKWIASGAEWEEHWSFVPVTKPQIPEVRLSDRVENPIDAFILKRLEKEQLEPSEMADRHTLIRRVTFDLTGLPPSPEDVDAFVNDTSEDAFEKVVDRLLASPHYGEHMARYWLDAARYGDTHGLHLDNYREMWPYRDWVVQAFNSNKSYRDFLIEQLAGDLLPEPTRDQLIATGFNRCHVTTSEGGSITEEVYVRNVVDRVVTFGTVGMGLTMDCTRCHDHKFDPMTMDDFYSLFAFFNSKDGSPLDGNRKDPAPVIKVPSPEQEQRMEALTTRVAELEKRMTSPWPEVDLLQAAWEKRTRQAFTESSRPDFLQADEFSSTTFEAAYIEAENLEAEFFESDTISAEGFKVDSITASNVRAENLKAETITIRSSKPTASDDAQLAAISLGDWYTVGPFNDVVRYLKSRRHGPEGKEINLEQEFETSNGEKLKWKKRTDWADGKPQTDLPGDSAANFIYRQIDSPKEQTIKVSLGSDDGIRVYLNGKRLLSSDAERGVEPDQEMLDLPLQAGANHLLIKILNFGGGSGYYFAIQSEVETMPAAVFQIARVAPEDMTQEQQVQLRDYFRNQVSEYEPLVTARENLKTSRNERNELDRQIPTTLVFREKEEPKEAFILTRGEYDQKGDPVDRATPAFLPPMDPDLPMNRLGLAQWLLDEDHPLTARVAVNRFWQQLFGTGLVKTSEDFGSQGSPPTHPLLLDWLAAQFMEDGWDIKRMMKRMVMSSTYRQSSAIPPHLLQRDPANRLLARGPRFRLDAEMLRDQALKVSGMLEDKMGGPSVKPPQPDGLWFAVGYSGSNTVRFEADKGPEKVHRRTLYTFIKRTAPPPQLSTFDAPSRESCTIRRERTNTPLQALLLMNDPQYVEAARALAQRVYQEGGETDMERARHMFQLATGRPPSDQECQELVQAVQEEENHYESNQADAKKLLAVGEYPVDESIDTSRLAAWTVTANMLLNLDEVIMKN